MQKIHDLVRKGISSVNEMRRHLREYVTSDLFCGQEVPPVFNRRFFPSKKDVRNHIYRGVVQNRFSKCDQTNVCSKVKEWQKQHPDDTFFFRPYADRHDDISAPDNEASQCSGSDDDDDDDDDDDKEMTVKKATSKQSLLFAHQTAWQKKLLRKYGNKICLLDATYRTTRYSLPLFFLAVKTNVDFQVVGSFVIQHESTESIKEALQLLKSWNPDWTPEFFMTDYSEQEINAVEEVLPGKICFELDKYFLCPTSRDVLCQLRRIAWAPSEEEFNEAVADLKSSNVWVHNKRIQHWFTHVWLRQQKVTYVSTAKCPVHIYRAVTHLPYMYNVIVYKKRFVFMPFVYTSSLFIKTMQFNIFPQKKVS